MSSLRRYSRTETRLTLSRTVPAIGRGGRVFSKIRGWVACDSQASRARDPTFRPNHAACIRLLQLVLTKISSPTPAAKAELTSRRLCGPVGTESAERRRFTSGPGFMMVALAAVKRLEARKGGWERAIRDRRSRSVATSFSSYLIQFQPHSVPTPFSTNFIQCRPHPVPTSFSSYPVKFRPH